MFKDTKMKGVPVAAAKATASEPLLAGSKGGRWDQKFER